MSECLPQVSALLSTQQNEYLIPPVPINNGISWTNIVEMQMQMVSTNSKNSSRTASPRPKSAFLEQIEKNANCDLQLLNVMNQAEVTKSRRRISSAAKSKSEMQSKQVEILAQKVVYQNEIRDELEYYKIEK